MPASMYKSYICIRNLNQNRRELKMKNLVLTLAICIAFPILGAAQSSNPFLSNYKKYEKVVNSIMTKENAKKKYSHINYRDAKMKRKYGKETPFTFARRKPKTPQNSYSYNW